AVLRSSQLVAGEQHRHAEREHQRREEIALLASAERDDRRVLGRPLDAAIPAEIAVVPVAILLAVRLVVLLVVADEVGEGEPVMGGDEVDAGPGATAGMAEDVGGAGEARGEVGGDPFIALPEAPDRVAILRVPLRPARREAAELVAVGAGVPWLGDGAFLGGDPGRADPGGKSGLPRG